MKSLYELYQEHDGKVSDKWLGYFDAYSRTLAAYRDQPVCLLEIGVQNGGSLEIWGKFFPNAEVIIGCDIDPACGHLQFADPHIRVVVGDAAKESTKSLLLALSSNFDIVIDDGSHKSGDIIRAFCQYFPLIKDGGIFIAEDLHCSYWGDYDGGLYHPYSSIAFFKRLADVVNFQHLGIDKSRAALVRGIVGRYNIELSSETLESVHSIEFINSVCIVRKRGSSVNTLGRRVVVGRNEAVAPGRLAVANTELKPATQANNQWSVLDSAPDEAYESLALKCLQQEKQVCELHGKQVQSEQLIQDLQRKLADNSKEFGQLQMRVQQAEQALRVLHKSLSWRITAPLRLLARPAFAAFVWTKPIRAAFDRNGGVRNSAKLAMWVLRHQGARALLQTIKTVVANKSSSGQSGNDSFDRNDYAEWVRRYDTLTDVERHRMRDVQSAFAVQPLVSVVMPTYNPKPEWLIEAIESVRNQIYPNWELCIADDASTNLKIRSILERYAAEDSRIKVAFRKENGHISAASNTALELVAGEWVALLDHDDLLSEHALFWVVEIINRQPETKLIYSDEDKVSEDGRRFGPYFKPDWNPDLFCSHNMISHLGVYSAPLIRKIGGFRKGFEGAQDYDLALRFIENIEPRQIQHIPRVLYHWRVHAESTALSADAKPYAMIAGERAINEHFSRTGVQGRVYLVGYGYEPVYELPRELPLVSIIIPTRNGLTLLRKCLDSIVEKTNYKEYEIVVIDNGSDDEQLLDYLKKTAGRLKSGAFLKVVRDEGAFNFSRLNNNAVRHAKGEVLALLNNDVEVISRDWLGDLVAHAIRADVGAVGARLWYPNDRLQHGGVVLGVGSVAAHAHQDLPKGSNGYFGRAALTQNFSAVTGACLVIERTKYLKVGGLNEIDLPIAYNDIDFCLRLAEIGFRTVWTPRAELYHHESATRGSDLSGEKLARLQTEAAYMKKRWGLWLANDPAYSPNLTLNHSDFSYAWPPRTRRLSEL